MLADNRFDAQTQRWFLTVLQLDVKPKTGSFSGRSHVLLAVSQTADPTKSFKPISSRAPPTLESTSGVARAWFATEYIPAAARTLLANWGTFIGEVIVEH